MPASTDTTSVSSFFDVFLRTIAVYVFMLIVVRLMGKREIGQLSPSDLVVAVVIGELAALALEMRNGAMAGLGPMAIIGIFELILSYGSLKSHWLRRILNGEPTVIIENGRLVAANLRKNRYNISDLLSQLRENDIYDIGEVEFAVLETSGKLSVLRKSQYRAVTPADLGILTPYEGLAYPIVCDGVVHHRNLERLGLTAEWLRERLEEHGASNPADVLLAVVNTEGKVYVSLTPPGPEGPEGRREKAELIP